MISFDLTLDRHAIPCDGEASTIIVTGGAGFIGSCFAKMAVKKSYKVIVLDKLTYSGNKENLAGSKVEFIQGDICDDQLVSELFCNYKPTAIINFAAESHVDNSISGPAPFVQTNLVGTFVLLKNALEYYKTLSQKQQAGFKFIHISTDEVYASLGPNDKPFSIETPYAPNSPYSSTKAGSDFLARSWHETYGLLVIITNCSNNFGPFQHEEKLIPKTIKNAISGSDIPVYAMGENIRDWIYVEDHCEGIFLALEKGRAGSKYLFGGDAEKRNIDVVNQICEIVKEETGKDSRPQIKFVEDRLGHDFRYAIDSSVAKKELGFVIKNNFDENLRNTVRWYIEREKL